LALAKARGKNYQKRERRRKKKKKRRKKNMAVLHIKLAATL
jgi:hypothetical protein